MTDFVLMQRFLKLYAIDSLIVHLDVHILQWILLCLLRHGWMGSYLYHTNNIIINVGEVPAFIQKENSLYENIFALKKICFALCCQMMTLLVSLNNVLCACELHVFCYVDHFVCIFKVSEILNFFGRFVLTLLLLVPIYMIIISTVKWFSKNSISTWSW